MTCEERARHVGELRSSSACDRGTRSQRPCRDLVRREASDQHPPDRQPRRDRAPRHPHRPRDGHPHRRRAHRRRPGRAARRATPTRRSRSAPTSTSTRSSAAAKSSGADAVHPGYGFLSERAAFAQALEDAGLTLVGPSAAVMEQMGRKDAAREVAVAAGVPVVPSYDVEADPATFAYPVLVKAAAGGGGKGMRIVRSRGRVRRGGGRRRSARPRRPSATTPCWWRSTSSPAATSRCRSSATPTATCCTSSSATARPSGATRRCSRRRPRRPSTTRSASGSPARPWRSPQQVGYVNAGTVEFLLDNDTGEFYFLEMNTRLQVEHPVTELVTGPRPRRAPAPGGCRRAAAAHPGRRPAATGTPSRPGSTPRTPSAGSCPQAGTADLVRWPTGVRVDHALETGQVVSTSYDPMLGKVIAYGPDREAARRALVAALDGTADPRVHHQRRLPARAGRLRRVPRRHHRHRVARHAPRSQAPSPDLPAHDRRVDRRDAARGVRRPGSLPQRRVPAGRRPGTDPGRARPGGAGRPRAGHRRRRTRHRARGR